MDFFKANRGGTRRATWWNYGSQAKYFITNCTKERECFFGEIRNGEMLSSEIGQVAHDEWLKTSDARPDMNLVLDEFVIMPNHFHAILEIKANAYNHKQLNNRDLNL